MGIIGYSSRGGGPGGVLPASTGTGQLLIGDGSGAWTGNANLPGLGPTPGQLVFWDGTSRYRYSAAPADGDVAVYDSATNQWVPRPAPTSFQQGFFGTNLIAGASFLYGSFSVGNTGNVEGAAGPFVTIPASTIPTMRVDHFGTQVGGNVTYTVFVNGNPTALTGVLNTNTASVVINIPINLAAGDRYTIQANHALGVAINALRVRVTLIVREIP